MVGQFLRVGYIPITETTGVVVAHLPFVIGIILVSQADALDGVVLCIEFTEDSQQFVGNEPVAHEFPPMGLLVIVPVEHLQVAEVAALHMGVGMPGPALHLRPDAVRDLMDREAVRRILGLHAQRRAKPEQDQG